MSHFWVFVWLFRFALSQTVLYNLFLLNTKVILLTDARRICLLNQFGVNGGLGCRGLPFLYDKDDLRSGVSAGVYL